MTGLKTYLVAINALEEKRKLSEPALKAAIRALGPHALPMVGWSTGHLLCTATDEPAERTANRVTQEVGHLFRVVVFQLGPDVAQNTQSDVHQGWMKKLEDLQRKVAGSTSTRA